MTHLERGFVVPVWFPRPDGSWLPGWAEPTDKAQSRLTLEGDPDLDPYVGPTAFLRPRDPNRTDQGDRPDLVEDA